MDGEPVKRKLTLTATMAALSLLLIGCGPDAATAPRGAAHLRENSVVGGAPAANNNAVETARQWKEKCAERTEECLRLERENTALTERNRKLMSETAALRKAQTLARKELDEANAMLARLNEDLAKWKSDVLGFREEMRQAQIAQIDLLKRIITLSGGELPDMANTTEE
ncbi:MAG: hypothetical protein J7M14_00665 [Planctomycetes bacterium]|nr:hypothetical protein [Planctomycetota bacterium]